MEENSLINCELGEKKMKESKSLQIRLMGHCIICLRKVSTKRRKISEYEGDSDSAPPEIAPKSVVTTPGFLNTFNQVWTVLQSKWKEKSRTTQDRSSSSRVESEICFKNVIQNGRLPTNVSFSRAPTICKLCCDKILAVENLMKAVRQQVREISMLLEDGRRRQTTGSGEVGEFEKNLRENGLEESVIKATLQFVGIFGSGCPKDDFKVRRVDNVIDDVSIKTVSSGPDQDSVRVGQDDSNDNDEVETVESSGEDDDDDSWDYIKEEHNQAENEEDDPATNEENESEEEMEVDEEDQNDPDYDGSEKEPFAEPKPKRTMKFVVNGKWNKLFGANEEEYNKRKFVCSCGRRYKSNTGLRTHMSTNRKLHPEYRPNQGHGVIVGNRQVCGLCGEWVMYDDILEHLTGKHLNGKDEWVIRCPNDKCRFMGVSKKEISRHLQSRKVCKVIGKEKWGPVCDTCGFKGTNMLVIRNHLKDKHENGSEEEKKWECPISGCGKRFCVRQSVEEHLYEHRRRPPITEQECDKCGGKFKVEEMEGHLRGEHGVGEVIGCGQCEMRFSGREEMVEHLYEHRGVGIRCDICGDKQEKLSRYSLFREHYFGVHNLCPKRYKCGGEGGCEMWFWRKELKEEHELKIHKESKKGNNYKKSVEKKEFECDVCNDKFGSENSLVSHKIKFHGEDPFTCDICGERFEYKFKLSRHKKEHAGIVVQKEWRCEVEGCGKIFKKKNYWKDHMEMGHGGKRPHVCEICAKGFTLAASLRKHRDSVHLKLKPWVCEECGERFGSSGVLKKHKLIHTGERPFRCEICGQRFRHKEVLKTHVKGHEEKGVGFKPNGPMKQIRKRKAE